MKTLRTLAAWGFFGLAGVLGSHLEAPASASDRSYWKTVVQYRTIHQPYTVYVTRYRACGTPYQAAVTKYRHVQVPYTTRVKVCR